MTKTVALLQLAERCENATGPDRELDCDIHAKLVGAPHRHQIPSTWPLYTASLDAAMQLVPEGWRLIDMCETVIEGDWPWYVRLREKRFDVSPGSAHSAAT